MSRKELENSSSINMIPIVAGLMLLFGGYLLLGGSVALSDNASADSSTSSGSTTTVSTDSVISITTPNSVTIDITPSFDSAVFATATATVSVTTNNAYGYSLSMGTSGTDSSGTATTSLIHKTKSEYTLPSITSATTQANFPTNSWGYTTNNNGTDTTLGQITAGSYQPLTTSSNSTLIKKTDTTASADTTTVTFAAKADSTLPSGDYSNTVVFSATANVPDALETISTMQEITSTLCSSNPAYEDNEKTYTLTDSRDNTTYQVRKLADGNCWMVENLALGTSDSAGITLTSDTSDVSSDWTLPAYTSIGTTWSSSTNDAYVIQGSTSASSSWTTGNWYTWGAATAGTASSATTSGTEASDSICPKGWQLPLGGSSSAWSSTTSKSFGNLFAAYSLTSSSSTTSTTIRAVPLSFSFAGWYNYDGGTVGGVGSNGGYWSSTASSSARAYGLDFYSSYVSPQNYGNRGGGQSVRCVAQ